MSDHGLQTSDDLNVELCTIGGTEHDWRPKTYTWLNRPHTSLVCVWCEAVCCGDPDDADPCIEAYHHHSPHRTKSGSTWPLGGSRP